MKKTKAQIIKEMQQLKKQLTAENKKLSETLEKEKDTLKMEQQHHDELCSRSALVAYYLQVLRVLPEYNAGNILSSDYDRMLDILQYNHFPDGF